jgi:hypothetical protein
VGESGGGGDEVANVVTVRSSICRQVIERRLSLHPSSMSDHISSTSQKYIL